MKKSECLSLFLLLGFFSLGHAQYSDQFLEISNALKPVDSVMREEMFSNGQLKEKGMFLIYETEDYGYEVKTGEWLEYYRSGELATKGIYDRHGFLLSWILYDKDGSVTWESELRWVDTSAKSPDQFLHGKNRYFDVEQYEKRYEYSNKLCEWYLRTEGLTLNFAKVGKWKVYNQNGSLKKEKIH